MGWTPTRNGWSKDLTHDFCSEPWHLSSRKPHFSTHTYWFNRCQFAHCTLSWLWKLFMYKFICLFSYSLFICFICSILHCLLYILCLFILFKSSGNNNKNNNNNSIQLNIFHFFIQQEDSKTRHVDFYGSSDVTSIATSATITQNGRSFVYPATVTPPLRQPDLTLFDQSSKEDTSSSTTQLQSLNNVPCSMYASYANSATDAWSYKNYMEAGMAARGKYMPYPHTDWGYIGRSQPLPFSWDPHVHPMYPNTAAPPPVQHIGKLYTIEAQLLRRAH